MDLPGGLKKREMDALRRLQRELAADGYLVGKVGLTAGGTPAALVYSGGERAALNRIFSAGRQILRLVGEVPAELLPVSAEELETLHALRVVAKRLAKAATVAEGELSVGDLARADVSRHVDAGMDREE